MSQRVSSSGRQEKLFSLEFSAEELKEIGAMGMEGIPQARRHPLALSHSEWWTLAVFAYGKAFAIRKGFYDDDDWQPASLDPSWAPLVEGIAMKIFRFDFSDK